MSLWLSLAFSSWQRLTSAGFLVVKVSQRERPGSRCSQIRMRGKKRRNTRLKNETCSFHRLRHKSDIQKAHLNHLNLCFHDLSKQICTENKSNSRLGEWAGPDTTCPLGEWPVCLFDGLFHEFFVLNGKRRWCGDGESHQKVTAAQISSMESVGTSPLFFPLLSFRNVSPSSNFPTQIWGEQRVAPLREYPRHIHHYPERPENNPSHLSTNMWYPLKESR